MQGCKARAWKMSPSHVEHGKEVPSAKVTRRSISLPDPWGHLSSSYIHTSPSVPSSVDSGGTGWDTESTSRACSLGALLCDGAGAELPWLGLLLSVEGYSFYSFTPSTTRISVLVKKQHKAISWLLPLASWGVRYKRPSAACFE